MILIHYYIKDNARTGIDRFGIFHATLSLRIVVFILVPILKNRADLNKYEYILDCCFRIHTSIIPAIAGNPSPFKVLFEILQQRRIYCFRAELG